MSYLRTATLLVAYMCLAINAAPYAGEPNNIVPFADADNYRLPADILPQHYELKLTPYLLESDTARFTFSGEAHITIKPSVNTNLIILHTKNLNYTSRSCATVDGKTIIELNNYKYNDNTDIITYTLTSNLTAGSTYILSFVYTGLLGDDMHGFYRSSYTDDNNVTKWLASTQFQTNHARRAFPSFDEPKFKATFNVTLIRPKSLKTVSNSELLTSTLNSTTGYITDVYKTTAKMSTYLLAFIISEFNERTDGTFSIVARPQYYDQTEYSFNVGPKLLNALDNYLNLSYYTLGVPKMHMAAIPDFSAGAMENWGLLTYRERMLLYADDATTLSTKQVIANVITHEQAHMWFGDLVTCDWWSYTWLNEGFARYFQYHGTAMVETEWELEKQFVVDQIQSVMNMDSTVNTNPMSDLNTNTPSDLSRMFNSISYNKGATIIRMIRDVIGATNFQKSLQDYLKENAYTNTVPSHLLSAWKKYWPNDTLPYADYIFNSFTTQVGYPLITATLTNGTLTLNQTRFLLKDNDGADKTLNYTVPITYTTNLENKFNDTTPKLILNATTATSAVESNVEWIILNIQESGYYRVNYDDNLWSHISNALLSSNWGGIHELNRAQIVDDLFNLARAGILEYARVLNILEYLNNEVNYLPWSSALTGYTFLTIRLGTDTDNFATYIRQLTSKAYNQLGFDESSNDTALVIYNRNKILSWSCRYRHSQCITKSKNLFNQLILNGKAVPKNIRSVVYCVALREGSSAEYNFLYNKYLTETVATEETLILTSLGCVREQALIEKHFEKILSNEIRLQDKSSAITALYTENNENIDPVFALVTARHAELATAMGSYASVASVISGLASRFTEESQKVKLEEFNIANGTAFGSSNTTLANAVKTVDENLAWSKDRLGTFKLYLENFSKDGATSLTSFTALSLTIFVTFSMLLR